MKSKYKNIAYKTHKILHKLSKLHSIFILISIFLIIGDLIKNLPDFIPPYGDILYHIFFSDYTRNIGYSFLASIVFYYIMEIKRYKKYEVIYHRLEGCFRELCTDLVNNLKFLTGEDKELINEFNNLFPDERFKCSHLDNDKLARLKEIVDEDFKGDKIVKFLNLYNNKSKNREILKAFGINFASDPFFENILEYYQRDVLQFQSLCFRIADFVGYYKAIIKWKDNSVLEFQSNEEELAKNVEFNKSAAFYYICVLTSAIDCLILLKETPKNYLKFILRD